MSATEGRRAGSAAGGVPPGSPGPAPMGCGEQPTTALIGLGSNLGPGPRLFERALDHLSREPRCRIVARSRWHRTRPMGPDQPPYWNGVVRIETVLGPEVLLALLHAIERDCGRVRSRRRWEARTLDLDLLDYGGLTLWTPRLRLPHGLDRAFLRLPLAEVSW